MFPVPGTEFHSSRPGIGGDAFSGAPLNCVLLVGHGGKDLYQRNTYPSINHHAFVQYSIKDIDEVALRIVSRVRVILLLYSELISWGEENDDD